jgi:hypothetical protein
MVQGHVRSRAQEHEQGQGHEEEEEQEHDESAKSREDLLKAERSVRALYNPYLFLAWESDTCNVEKHFHMD